jgi:cobalt-precorrin 5A hydrolase
VSSSIALVTLSEEGAVLLRRLQEAMPEADAFVHRSAASAGDAEPFDSVMDLTGRIFDRYQGIVYVLPCGVAVRAVAPHLESKKTDPAVVVADVGGRWSVSLLSGHEGGANRLAVRVANVLGAEPVVSTTTEARKTVIAGVGCRRGVAAETILEAIRAATEKAEVDPDQIRLIASADIKSGEEGLINTAEQLGCPLRFITSEEIRSTCKSFERSQFVEEKVGLPAVCEPAALLAGRRTRLVLPKTKIGPVTVALARESCMWSG